MPITTTFRMRQQNDYNLAKKWLSILSIQSRICPSVIFEIKKKKNPRRW